MTELGDHTQTYHIHHDRSTSDQPDAETSIWQHKKVKKTNFIPPVGKEPAVSASKGPQNHALDRPVAGISYYTN
jgi:hypothetical protein